MTKKILVVEGEAGKKTGSQRRYMYRFVDPQVSPFVTMHGLAKKLIDPAVWRELSGMN